MDDIKILHISDTHFGAHEERKRSALVEFAREWDADIIAITGDILDSPMPWQSSYFDHAKIFIDEMHRICSSAVFCIPGNHDALLGSVFLNRFWRKLQAGSTSFVVHRKVRGQDVCLICVDTTSWHLPHLNNSGIFDYVIESQLRTDVNRLLNRRGIDIEKAITVALVHHHPIPTPLTAAAEEMLYFKNAGRFLKFATEHHVRLILHGHQHDPHFAKLGFGTDQDNKMIGILSAGSCIKTDHGKQEFSGCGHFFTVRINHERTLVNSFYYSRTADDFVAHETFSVYRIAAVSYPQLVTVDQSFTVIKNGDMKAREIRVYKRTTDGASSVDLSIGVDDKSKACPENDLRLTVTVDRRTGDFAWLEDKPRYKRFNVPVGYGQKGAQFEVEINYTWPGGFQSFLDQGIDSGEFQIVGEVNWCRVTLDLEETNVQLAPLAIYGKGRTQPSTGSGRQQTFTIYEPRGLISWSARIMTAQPEASGR
jgi:3',5'-cyclic AMP phosphodiesterase CpdA